MSYIKNNQSNVQCMQLWAVCMIDHKRWINSSKEQNKLQCISMVNFCLAAWWPGGEEAISKQSGFGPGVSVACATRQLCEQEVDLSPDV